MTDKMKKALVTLELPERASIRQIRKKYKELVKHWHPDKRAGKPEECHENTIRVIEAYKMIMEYCENYGIPFHEPDNETQEEFWKRRFGDDPMWGNPWRDKNEK